MFVQMAPHITHTPHRVGVCEWEKNLKKTAFFISPRNFTISRRNFTDYIYRDFPSSPGIKKKSLLSWSKLAKKTHQKSGDVSFFFFFFFIQLLPLAVADDIKVSKDDNMLEKKSSGYYKYYTKKTQSLGGKKVQSAFIEQRRNFESYRMCKKKKKVS